MRTSGLRPDSVKGMFSCGDENDGEKMRRRRGRGVKEDDEEERKGNSGVGKGKKVEEEELAEEKKVQLENVGTQENNKHRKREEKGKDGGNKKRAHLWPEH